jgi:hypothetical protein
MEQEKTISIRILACFKSSFPRALKAAWWMIRIMLPVSLAVMLLEYFGMLQYISKYLTPIFSHIGLPGESALVYITSILLSIYAAIAVIGTLALDMREITILAIMCLIAHNMIVETAIQKKTGSSAGRIIILRILCSFIAAFILNWLLPEKSVNASIIHEKESYSGITPLLKAWFDSSFWLSLKVITIVCSLMFLQKLLDEFGVMNVLSKIFRPLMKPMGLSERISFHWLIANTVGLTYGSAIMFDEVETGKLKLYDAKFLNHHIAINHSLLEDTLLFVAIGVPAAWITFPRIIIAIIAVWLYRAELYMLKKN